MSQIRKAHSVEIIDRHLKQYQTSGVIDAMELVNLHDELARVERKYVEKAAAYQAGRPQVKPLPSATLINDRFTLLKQFVETALRRTTIPAPERLLLQKAMGHLKSRAPLTAASAAGGSTP